MFQQVFDISWVSLLSQHWFWWVLKTKNSTRLSLSSWRTHILAEKQIIMINLQVRMQRILPGKVRQAERKQAVSDEGNKAGLHMHQAERWWSGHSRHRKNPTNSGNYGEGGEGRSSVWLQCGDQEREWGGVGTEALWRAPYATPWNLTATCH